MVRDGQNINLWHDLWLNNIPLRQQISGPLTVNDFSKNVSSIIDSTINSKS